MKYATKILFLDLDGTVRHGVEELGHFVGGPEDVIVYPGVKERIAAWKKETRGRVVGVTNQGGIGDGKVSEGMVVAAIDYTNLLLGKQLDVVMYCPHPTKVVECLCRKPQPGMLSMAIMELERRHPFEMYPKSGMTMVGDRDEDMECARRAGIEFVTAREWRGDAVRVSSDS